MTWKRISAETEEKEDQYGIQRNAYEFISCPIYHIRAFVHLSQCNLLWRTAALQNLRSGQLFPHGWQRGSNKDILHVKRALWNLSKTVLKENLLLSDNVVWERALEFRPCCPKRLTQHGIAVRGSDRGLEDLSLNPHSATEAYWLIVGWSHACTHALPSWSHRAVVKKKCGREGNDVSCFGSPLRRKAG